MCMKNKHKQKKTSLKTKEIHDVEASETVNCEEKGKDAFDMGNFLSNVAQRSN